MGKEIAVIQATAIEQAETGATYQAIADGLGISIHELNAIRRANPAFRQMLADAMLEGSEHILEAMLKVPDTESKDPAWVRVKIEAMRLYLEMRWPDRYGKRMQVTVRHLDMSQALAKARERASQAHETQGKLVKVATDSQSVATYVPDTSADFLFS